MARTWDEQFEAAGYDETWNDGETVGGGCTLDEDADVADVGSPSGWGSKCLKVISSGTNDAYVRHSFAGDISSGYLRIEFVISSESLADGQTTDIFRSWDAGFGAALAVHIYQSGGSLYIRSRVDGTNHSGTAISTGTRYRYEHWWDVSSGWESRLDGVMFDSGPDGECDREIKYMRLGMPSSGATGTFYIDNFAIDDADWVGPEGGAGVSPTGVFYGPLVGPMGGPI